MYMKEWWCVLVHFLEVNPTQQWLQRRLTGDLSMPASCQVELAKGYNELGTYAWMNDPQLVGWHFCRHLAI